MRPLHAAHNAPGKAGAIKTWDLATNFPARLSWSLFMRIVSHYHRSWHRLSLQGFAEQSQGDGVVEETPRHDTGNLVLLYTRHPLLLSSSLLP